MQGVGTIWGREAFIERVNTWLMFPGSIVLNRMTLSINFHHRHHRPHFLKGRHSTEDEIEAPGLRGFARCQCNLGLCFQSLTCEMGW